MIEQYAVIVGLVSAFSSSRGAQTALDLAEFQSWLIEHNHEDIVQLLNVSAKTNTFVKAYLNQQVPEIQSKLDTIINLVEVMASDSENSEMEFSGQNFLRGVALLGLERVIGSRWQAGDFDAAHSYVLEMIGGHAQYNKYVSRKDCS